MRRFRRTLAAIAVVLGALAQPALAQAKLPRIGVLSPGDEKSALITGFREGLKQHGYSAGRNLQIEYRWALGNLDRLPALAAELVGLELDVIVAIATQASLAAQAATRKVPIVIVGVADPLGVGLIASLSRPGGNITGTATQQVDMVGKQVELTRQLDSDTSSVAVLWNPTNPAFHELQVREERSAAAVSGLPLRLLAASTADEFAPAFEAMRRDSVRTLLILADPLFALHRRRLADAAVSERVVTICGSRDFSESGCLISYGPSYFEASRRAATYVHKILQGARPADLPVEQPTKFDLLINLKAAKQIGVTIPANVLARADRVIK
jgi:putative tryptophan/tyrosine transport system substrate-binding protein